VLADHGIAMPAQGLTGTYERVGVRYELTLELVAAGDPGRPVASLPMVSRQA
jgi:hypothetical protein